MISLLMTGAVCWAQRCWAQVDAGSAPSDAGAPPGSEEPAPVDLSRQSAPQPPQLLTFVEALYPPDAAAHDIQGVVRLVLTVDAGGRVASVEVAEPAGHGFDEAAIAAALQFRFEPARLDGVPIAARVSYRYEFRRSAGSAAQRPPVPAESAAPEPPAIDVTIASKRRSPLPVELVNRAELRRANANNAADVLQRLPGVTTEGPHNQRDRNQFVSLRGLPPEYTLVLIDGQRTATEGRGRVNLATIPLEAIEGIEVVRGPQAVIFGADAIGGVVNVLTRPGASSPDRLLLDTGYGAFETAHAAGAARVSGAPGALRMTASYGIARAGRTRGIWTEPSGRPLPERTRAPRRRPTVVRGPRGRSSPSTR
jgi:vitamin B12 transporter